MGNKKKSKLRAKQLRTNRLNGFIEDNVQKAQTLEKLNAICNSMLEFILDISFGESEHSLDADNILDEIGVDEKARELEMKDRERRQKKAEELMKDLPNACPDCHGHGGTPEEPCHVCHGSGHAKETAMVE